ncbi:hypothetical protein V1505DRAFT_382169, partial [Lipomyces doorenjongii]
AKGEWCWADCGYPLYDWLPSPYRKPDKYEDRKRECNFIRIVSEHCNAYLKPESQRTSTSDL